MRNTVLAVVIAFLSPGIALARPVGEPSGALSAARTTVVPLDSVPELARLTLEREAAGQTLVTRKIHLGDVDIFEGQFGGERVRVADDGTIVGRDEGPRAR